MKKYFLVVFILAFLLLTGFKIMQQNTRSFYFYSEEDIQNIKKSARTEWGAKIIDTLREKVNERLTHTMNVPFEEGGYFHDYFCPIHNIRFDFDWKKPHAHYCRLCKKYWENEKRFDWAWIAGCHDKNLEFLVANMYLFLATDSVVYAQNIKKLLLDYASAYPGYAEHNRLGVKKPDNYCGKMYSQSLDEAVWAIDAARAYAVAEKIMSSEEKTIIENGYLKECAALLLSKTDKGNWQAWHNGAIIALGVALKDDSLIDVAINKPVYGYRALIRANVYPDGWWDEGSVVYHFYPLRSFLLTAEAARCHGIDLYDYQLYLMFVSPINMIYADLTFPAQNDGWYGTSLYDQVGLYEIAAKRYKDPLLDNMLRACYGKIERSRPESLINGSTMDMTSSELNLAGHLFPDLGVGVLRSHNRTVVLKYGPDGGIHGHPDKLSISIHNGVVEILPDLGTPSYGVPICREWYQNTFAHNTVTVDMKNQLKSCGQLAGFVSKKNGGYINATADKAYPGVGMNRKITLKNNRLTDQFTCRSVSVHTYDYILILQHPVNIVGAVDSTETEYKHIENVRRKSIRKELRLKLKDADLKIRVKSHQSFEVITGTAPGIPPSLSAKEGKESYPVIIRTKDKDLDIVAKWRLK